MKVSCFSVKNFRSIINASELPIYNLSILIGPNNEGKSNFLQALVMTLKFVSGIDEPIFSDKGRHRTVRRHRSESVEDRTNYIWDRDFPLKLRETKQKGRTIFTIEFTLNNREKNSFKNLTKISIQENLKVKLELGKTSGNIKIFDTENPKKKIQIDYNILMEFIKKHLLVQYISAVRTSDTTRDIVDDLISNEITELQKEISYKKLLEKLEKIQKPVLAKLSKSLTKSVSNFLPDVKKIELDSQERFRRIIHESCNIIIDDGTKTDLTSKGDGIKSLLAISIIQHTTQKSSLNKNIILAIEEPESHLHPEAIHRLRKVLEDISSKNQVIITTHSPLLINRAVIKKNLLVNKSNVSAAKDIAEVRELLGAHVSDNLSCANFVILVEGIEDINILKTWICSSSPLIESAIDAGRIIFDHLNGSSNLSYKISLWKALLCDIYVFLDGDASGEKAFKDAEMSGLITEKEACFTKLRGYKEAEIEDFIEINTYKEIIKKEYLVNLEGNIFRNNKKKWSERVKDTFHQQGKRWPPEREAEIKKIVSEEVTRNGLKSLKKTCSPCINTAVEFIENYLKQNN